MKEIRFVLYKATFHFLLRLPNAFYATVFTLAFPIYKALHTKRAYGRVARHLEKARRFQEQFANGTPFPLQKTTPRDVFKGIFWNALDSYRGLAHFRSVEDRIVYENEEIIRQKIVQAVLEKAEHTKEATEEADKPSEEQQENNSGNEPQTN